MRGVVALRTMMVWALLISVVAGAIAKANTVSAVVEIKPASQTVEITALVGAGGGSLLSAPGGEPLSELVTGTKLIPIGRSADGVWTAVRVDEQTAGWIASEDILMFGADRLPVIIGDDLPSGQGGVPVSLPTPTSTPEPTATPTATPTPFPTPTATLSPPVSAVLEGLDDPRPANQVAVVRSGGTDLVDAPGGAPVQTLPTGTALTVWARTADGVWLAAITPAGARGWVEAARIVAFNLDRLPLASDDDLVAAVPNSGSEAELPAPSDDNSTEPVAAEVASREATQPLDSGVTATVAITDSRLNIRSGPDTEYRVLVKALPGERFTAIGRTSDSKWIQIAGDRLNGETGWAAAEYLSLTGQILDLPVTGEEEPQPVATDSGSGDVAPPASLMKPPAVQATRSGLSGNLVIATSSANDVSVIDLGSGEIRYLTSGLDPAISPDGTTVAFTRDGGANGLYLVDIDGANERRIYAGGEGLRSPAWSPDGKYVIFSRLAGDYKCRDVGFGICLPDNPFLSDFDLVTKPEYGLSRVNTAGGDFRDLPALSSAKAPSWSPSGIVYQSNTGLEITSDDPNGRTKLLLSAPYYQDPDWQPGGNRIAFQSREGSHWEIFTVNDDGGGLGALTRPVTTLVDELPSNVAPAWSPNGEQIVYLSNRDERNSAGEWRLWVMDADGSNQRPLEVQVPVGYSYAAEQVLDWGPTPAR